mmetsp:Transcript_82438/g.183121  ORF Transcript_82438/g.183121 Transcript_82438/m.183121 type:complete len:278 (-) Transcript_82438:427-1260(-)
MSLATAREQNLTGVGNAEAGGATSVVGRATWRTMPLRSMGAGGSARCCPGAALGPQPQPMPTPPPPTSLGPEAMRLTPLPPLPQAPPPGCPGATAVCGGDAASLVPAAAPRRRESRLRAPSWAARAQRRSPSRKNVASRTPWMFRPRWRSSDGLSAEKATSMESGGSETPPPKWPRASAIGRRRKFSASGLAPPSPSPRSVAQGGTNEEVEAAAVPQPRAMRLTLVDRCPRGEEASGPLLTAPASASTTPTLLPGRTQRRISGEQQMLRATPRCSRE